MIAAIDGDVILRGVASQVCPKVSATASTSDVAAYLSASTPAFVTWNLRVPRPVSTLQTPTRVSFEAQVTAHGYSRGQAKQLSADLFEVFRGSVGRVFEGVEVKSVRCRQLATEIRFDGQSTTHNRFISTFAVTAATH